MKKHTFVVFLDGTAVVAILEEFVTRQLERIGLIGRAGGLVRRGSRTALLGAVGTILLQLRLLRINVH